MIMKIFLHAALIFTFPFSEAKNEEEWEKYSPEELERQFDTQIWNPNKTPEQVIDEYIQTGINATQYARDHVPNHLNVSYGPREDQVYDVYGTDLPSNSTTLVWIHGGFWQKGSKETEGGPSVFLYSKKIRNVVLEYTLAPNATVKEIQREVASALDQIVKSYPKSKIVLGGHSAGSQLSSLILHSNIYSAKVSKQIKALLLVSGVFDLRPLTRTSVNKHLGLTQCSADESSPLRIRNLRKEFKNRQLEILIMFGEWDSDEFKRQSKDYHKLLRKYFCNVKLQQLERDDHYTIVENIVKKNSPFVQFIKRVG